MLNVDFLGQVFTEEDTVKQMLAMRKNTGRVLEPSCGAGAFSQHMPGCVAVEFDPAVCPAHALNMDFFSYPLSEQFDTIIGNPPYVKYRNIAPETRARLDMRLFDERANLYLFFIEKCVRHLKPGGELIFITPRDFLKATSAVRLNEFLFSEGTITDLLDLGDAAVFPGFNPNCVIFRFEKGNFSRVTNRDLIFSCVRGQLLFTSSDYTVPFSSLFTVKVGAVSGADAVFSHPEGNLDFVCSKTIDTGETRRMIYNRADPRLTPHKDTLLSRRIRTFSERNWWEWGRGYHVSDAPRIYVNVKTRRESPFFMHECKAYDGSILALFPRREDAPLTELTSALNAVDWAELGFVCDGRHLFSQRALETCQLPAHFAAFSA